MMTIPVIKCHHLATLLLIILLLFTGCTTDETTETTAPEILTNVFRVTTLSLPETYTLTNVTPYHNAAEDELTLLCRVSMDSMDEYHTITIDPEGILLSDTPLTMPEDISIGQGVLREDFLAFPHTVYDEITGDRTIHLALYSLTDHTLRISDDLTSQFPIPTEDSRIRIDSIAADMDGILYIASDINVFAFDQSFTQTAFYPIGSWINDLVTSPDGTVHIAATFNGRYSLLPIDCDTKDMLSPLPLPDNINGADFFFGNGYDLYYATDTGLFGYNFAESGQPKNEPVFLLDYANSNLIRDSIDILHIYSPDRLLLAEFDQTTYSRTPILCERSADIDLSQIITLTIAYTEAENDLNARIIEFNKANRDVCIVPMDYSVYSTRENKNGGEQKLLTDILTGTCTPDMVAGLNTSDLIRQLYKNSLYTDLYPLMEQSGTLSKDDLLGCVTRTCETTEGKLWTIGRTFYVDTIIARSDMVDGYENWTLAELIDFAQTLPDDVELFSSLSQEDAANNIFGTNGDGYNAFIDYETNTCHFESEGFLRYLVYLQMLPKTYEEAIAGCDPRYDSRQGGNWLLQFIDGKIALKKDMVSNPSDWLANEAVFNTPDYTLIGAPTANGTTSGSTLVMDSYVLLPDCETTEKAWAFLESLVTYSLPDAHGYFRIPTTKEEFFRSCQSAQKVLYEIKFSGGTSGYAPWTQEELETPMDEPGIKRVLTDEAIADMLDWLDHHAGAPTVTAIAPEILQIIREETNALISGRLSPEECAAVIQSRVSLWLSEHD